MLCSACVGSVDDTSARAGRRRAGEPRVGAPPAGPPPGPSAVSSQNRRRLLRHTLPGRRALSAAKSSSQSSRVCRKKASVSLVTCRRSTCRRRSNPHARLSAARGHGRALGTNSNSKPNTGTHPAAEQLLARLQREAQLQGLHLVVASLLAGPHQHRHLPLPGPVAGQPVPAGGPRHRFWEADAACNFRSFRFSSVRPLHAPCSAARLTPHSGARPASAACPSCARPAACCAASGHPNADPLLPAPTGRAWRTANWGASRLPPRIPAPHHCPPRVCLAAAAAARQECLRQPYSCPPNPQGADPAAERHADRHRPEREQVLREPELPGGAPPLGGVRRPLELLSVEHSCRLARLAVLHPRRRAVGARLHTAQLRAGPLGRALRQQLPRGGDGARPGAGCPPAQGAREARRPLLGALPAVGAARCCRQAIDDGASAIVGITHCRTRQVLADVCWLAIRLTRMQTVERDVNWRGSYRGRVQVLRGPGTQRMTPAGTVQRWSSSDSAAHQHQHQRAGVVLDEELHNSCRTLARRTP